MWNKKISTSFNKRLKEWPGKSPYISFSFDDFPRSALLEGARILEKYNVRATYYVSLGLEGKENKYYEYFKKEDLYSIRDMGHELGSHSYYHSNAWLIRGRDFEFSIMKNQEIISNIIKGYEFKSFSYCYTHPFPINKKIAEKYFLCCRGGVPIINEAKIDVNMLGAFFIDQYTREIRDYFIKLIDKNIEKKGWLIIVTHDIKNDPSPYGCSPFFFENVVRYAYSSGAKILPIINVYKETWEN